MGERFEADAIEKSVNKEDKLGEISGSDIGNNSVISDSWKPECTTESKEDKEKRKETSSPDELRGNVLGILNKLVPQNYSDVILQIKNLKIDTADKLEQMVTLIYEKAINKPTFSALYAKVCRELSECAHLANVPTDHQQKSWNMRTSFRKLLLNKCLKEFETMREAQAKALKREKEEMTLKEEFDCEERINRHQISIRNMRFIGELFKLRMISEYSIHNQVIVPLLCADGNREESFECMCELLSIVGKDLDHPKGNELRGNVLGILNKLVPPYYSPIVLQIKNLKIDTADKLEQMVALIYEKAISKPTFSALYAKVCRELSDCAHLANIPTDLQQKSEIIQTTTSFRKLLLNKCQKEFEAMIEAQTKALKTEKEEMTLKEEFDCEERINRHQISIRNMRFIGELFKLRMISERIIHNQVIVKLLRRDNGEESLECLCELLSIVGKDLDHPKGKIRMDQYFQRMNKFLKVKKISTHIKSAFQDVMELRQNNWIHRRQEKNYTTINLVGKEVKKKPEQPHRKSNNSQGW